MNVSWHALDHFPRTAKHTEVEEDPNKQKADQNVRRLVLHKALI